eukprot:5206987-Prymnesium_polylepis.1
MAVTVTADAEAARAEAALLRVKLEQATAGADAIEAAMKARLQEVKKARQSTRVIKAKEFMPFGDGSPRGTPRDATQRAEKRRQTELQRDADERMA